MANRVPDGMSDADAQVLSVWHAHEDRLFGLAYRMLGSVADAQDVLQEAFVRLRNHGITSLHSPSAWLTTVVTRLCLHQLDSARVRREQYVGPWLPEPLATTADASENVLQAESLSAAFLVVLESLSPAERAAFILHDVFGYPHSEVADMLGRGEAACRQLATRARKAIAARRPRYQADAALRTAVTDRFLDACIGRDMSELLALLSPDVVLHNDGGGKTRAARKPIYGADRVARFVVGVLGTRNEWTPTRAVIHQSPGVIFRAPDGAPGAVLSATVDDRGLITTAAMVVNPAKLTHIAHRRG